MKASDAFDLALRAPCRNEHRANRALLQLSIAPSLTRPSPLTVSPRLKTVLLSFRATQSAWPPHSRCRFAKTPPHPRHASALHRSHSACRYFLRAVFRPLAGRVNPLHLAREELAANARICDRLHHSNRPATGLDLGLARLGVLIFIITPRNAPRAPLPP